MKLRNVVVTAVACFGAVLIALPAHASPILGTVNTVGAATVSNGAIDFLSTTDVANLFNVSVPVSGSFAGMAGTSGSISNLTPGPEPVGTPFTDTGWMLFALANGQQARFDLNFINPGDFTTAGCGGTAAAGQTCTPFVGSPFDLTNLGPTPGGAVTGVLVGFGVSGTAVNTVTGETSHFTGSFSTQINGTTIQALLADLAADEGTGSVTNAYSANFTVATPEPSTILLSSFGFALIGLSRLYRRKRANKA